MKSLFLLHEYLAFISFGIIALPVPGAACLHVRPGRGDALHHAVGLGGRSQQNGRLGQRQLRLGQTQLHGGVHAGLDDADRLGIGHADILTGGAQQPPAGGHQISRLQKAGQIVQRRVRVAAPQGLHQGGGQVVHGVAPLVIAHGAALSQL